MLALPDTSTESSTAIGQAAGRIFFHSCPRRRQQLHPSRMRARCGCSGRRVPRSASIHSSAAAVGAQCFARDLPRGGYFSLVHQYSQGIFSAAPACAAENCGATSRGRRRRRRRRLCHTGRLRRKGAHWLIVQGQAAPRQSFQPSPDRPTSGGGDLSGSVRASSRRSVRSRRTPPSRMRVRPAPGSGAARFPHRPSVCS